MEAAAASLSTGTDALQSVAQCSARITVIIEQLVEHNRELSLHQQSSVLVHKKRQEEELGAIKLKHTELEGKLAECQLALENERKETSRIIRERVLVALDVIPELPKRSQVDPCSDEDAPFTDADGYSTDQAKWRKKGKKNKNYRNNNNCPRCRKCRKCN